MLLKQYIRPVQKESPFSVIFPLFFSVASASFSVSVLL